MRILAGDIGGTTTRLAIYEDAEIIYERQYPSQAVKDITKPLNDFINGFKSSRPQKACLAVAGIIDGNRATATNLPWVIDGGEAAKSLGIKGEDVRLVNDFEAAALGITALEPSQLIKIGGGEPIPNRPKALIGAGTGLGEAIIVPVEQGKFKIIATEGGHADFAPVNETEIGLLRHLIKKFGHVSTERVLSGPGLVNIYNFILEKKDGIRNPPITDPAEITKGAVERRDIACIEALEIFSSIYGSEAGNLALKCLATGGIYLWGGIAAKILPFLTDGRFRTAFEAKGRMSAILKNIPVFLVIEPRLGLMGARIIAQEAHAPN